MIPLILYDIPSKLEGSYWSPNTVKPRQVNLTLVSSGSSLQVEWVEYPDIAQRMKQIGARKNKFAGGVEMYTLPVLSDPNTNALITDSWEIAEYLEKTYPENKGLICVFDTAIFDILQPSIPFHFLRTSQILSERSAEYFITTKAALLRRKFSEFSPEGPKRDEHWAIIKRAMETLKEWYDKEEGKWLMGDIFSYADIITAQRLFWFKRILHDDEWEKITSWHDGRWGKLLADVEKECNRV
ncbi:hypothetical protein BKA83DRAFT_88250 [Pisolithus microcarpus]|nr:hypothetical protein BKA83DRAFT_88250 [Pisolithus microcarpus]